MKLKTLALTLALCFGGAATALAQSPHMGTWKLNEAKSNIAAGTIKNTTVVCEAQGDNIKITNDGTGADGAPRHTEWTGQFDGKDYPVTGDPTRDTAAYTKVDDNTLTLAVKKGSAVVSTARIVISADGKTRTSTVHLPDASGKQVTSTLVYDKQ